MKNVHAVSERQEECKRVHFSTRGFEYFAAKNNSVIKCAGKKQHVWVHSLLVLSDAALLGAFDMLRSKMHLERHQCHKLKTLSDLCDFLRFDGFNKFYCSKYAVTLIICFYIMAHFNFFLHRTITLHTALGNVI